MNTLEKAIKIIVANEGNYASVNADDNGALSIGKCQWHADRAKKLLQTIWKAVKLPTDSNWYIFELKLFDKKSWSEYVPTASEIPIIKYVLSTPQGKEAQGKLINTDVQGYINSIMKQDITEENSIIFLADIYNQSPVGCKRIINATFEAYGKHATLDNFMHTALCDKIFKSYKLRRYNVYRTLTGKNYFPDGEVYIHTVVKNETLFSIAMKYDTSVSRLVIDNEIENPNRIYVGQKIKIIKEI